MSYGLVKRGEKNCGAPTVTNRVLFVDDDLQILERAGVELAGRADLQLADNGNAAIKILERDGPFAVVMSDLRMPAMDGIDFLRRSFEIAPESVRILAAGAIDFGTVVDAINEVHVFRFVQKPYRNDILVDAVDQALEQYRLLHAEEELVQRTLTGSIKTLVDILSLNNPVAFGRVSRVRRVVQELTSKVDVPNAWEVNVAAILYQIGLVALPETIWSKVRSQQQLTAQEADLLERHPQVAADLIKNIPRLESVAEIILYQNKRFDGRGFPNDSRRGEEIPLGARLLRLAADFESLVANGGKPQLAYQELCSRTADYDPVLVQTLGEVVMAQSDSVVVSMSLSEVRDQAVVAEDIVTARGELLVSAGCELTTALKEKIAAHIEMGEVRDLVLVRAKASGSRRKETPTSRPVDLLA